MKKVTIADLNWYRPCYPPTEFLPEDWQGTLVDILDVTECPIKDRIWMVTRPGLFFTDRQLRHFACDCAERALSRVKNPDERSINAIKVSRRYADGKATLTELSTAYAAAYVAYAATRATYATDAATYAATAAYAAACAVATDYDDASAVATDYDDASAVVAYAARDAERLWQIERLKEIALWEETL